MTLSLRRRLQIASGAGALLIGAASLALPSPYMLESPGPTFNTIGEIEDEPVTSVSGTETYDAEGTLALTTIYVTGAPTQTVRVPQAVRGWASGTTDMTPHELVYPTGTTAEEVRQRNTEAMASSQQLSLAAALNHLDVDFEVELFVADFTQGAIEAGTDELLNAGDRVVEAAGEPVTGLEGLRTAVNEASGEPIELTVLRDGDQVDVDVETYQEADGEYYVGILLGNEFEFPVDAEIQLQDVGGPSAGLMFSLGLIDTMTEESLTGGEQWAGTGTVDPDGTVGPIGGAPLKLVGAQGQGAERFLAPQDNCDELEGRLPQGLDVYGVESVDEAVAVVEAVRDGDEDFLAGVEPCGR
ncbi:MAG: YlbL family protein [Nesterenkonia sp.]